MVHCVESGLPESVRRLAGRRRGRSAEMDIGCTRDPYINYHDIQHRRSGFTFTYQNMGRLHVDD